MGPIKVDLVPSGQGWGAKVDLLAVGQGWGTKVDMMSLGQALNLPLYMHGYSKLTKKVCSGSRCIRIHWHFSLRPSSPPVTRALPPLPSLPDFSSPLGQSPPDTTVTMVTKQHTPAVVGIAANPVTVEADKNIMTSNRDAGELYIPSPSQVRKKDWKVCCAQKLSKGFLRFVRCMFSLLSWILRYSSSCHRTSSSKSSRLSRGKMWFALPFLRK